MKTIKSTCTYCGCGCQLNYEVDNEGKISKILPVLDDPASRGKPCIKGLTLNSLDLQDRIKTPKIKKNGKWEDVDLEETKKYIFEKTKDLKGDEVAFIGSGDSTNEDNFILSKFARVVFGSNNIDCCARLCHSATTTAMRKMFGNPAMPNYMDDLIESDLIIMTGTNPAGNYPVAFQRIMEAKKNGAKLVCIDIEQSETTRLADIFINIRFSESVTLFGGIIKKIIEEKNYDKEKNNLENFYLLSKSVEKFNEKYVLEKCDLPREVFDSFYQLIKESKKPTFMHGMGMTQHANGVNNVSAILNLSILKDANVIPMRGKINVQGAGDMGTCPDWVPFGGSPSQTKKIWHEVLNDTPGHHLTEFMYDPKIKAVFVLVANPAQSMPDLNKLHKKLENTFVVYIHYYPSKTFEFADVAIPTPLLFENDGTITNAERRVEKVNSINGINKIIQPAWKFLSDLSFLFGKEKEFQYNSTEEIFEEIKKANPAYANLDIEKINNNNNNFADKEKFFEKFLPIDDENPEREIENKDYPFLLTTQRSPHHFCTGELTRRNEKLLKLTPFAFCKINEEDAKNNNITEGEKIILESPLGEIEITAKVSTDFKKGVLSVPFHFENTLVNKLFEVMIDPISKEPNLKSAWVKIKKVK